MRFIYLILFLFGFFLLVNYTMAGVCDNYECGRDKVCCEGGPPGTIFTEPSCVSRVSGCPRGAVTGGGGDSGAEESSDSQGLTNFSNVEIVDAPSVVIPIRPVIVSNECNNILCLGAHQILQFSLFRSSVRKPIICNIRTALPNNMCCYNGRVVPVNYIASDGGQFCDKWWFSTCKLRSRSFCRVRGISSCGQCPRK